MRALFFEEGLGFRDDYPHPVPHNNEALVRVSCAGICNTDIEITKGYMGFTGVLGHEFAGVVEKCSDTGLVGRRVTGEINIGCGTCEYCRSSLKNHCPARSVLGILNKDGAFADYLTLPAGNLHILPDSISDEEAVFVEPLAAAFEILEQVNITSADKVCVLGDGKLGLLIAQVLSAAGCKLIAVGKHRDKLSILEKKNIKTAMAPLQGITPISPALTKDDENPDCHPEFISGSQTIPVQEIPKQVRDDRKNDGSVVFSSKKSFDIVVESTGSQTGLETALRIVKPRGKVILKTTIAGSRPIDLNSIIIDEVTIIGSRCGPFQPAIKALETKSVDVTPMISKVFPIKDGVEAMNYASQKGVMKVLLKFS